MKNYESKITFKEIKNYEEAYYYNSDPINRKSYDNKNEKEKKKFKISNGLLELIGSIIEGILEILFSILD